jgi:uncharacterized protein
MDNIPVDDDVLFATAMLHDIAAFRKWANADKDHADQAIEILPVILREHGFPEGKIPAVLESVRTHFLIVNRSHPKQSTSMMLTH